MSSHKRKMIAPIVVALILILYYVAYFALIMSLVGTVGKILLGIIPLVFAVLMIAVCIERIKEIKQGEEDDLSQY